MAAPLASDSPAPLKTIFKNDFLIGAALNESQFTEQNAPAVDLIKKQFNSISPENVLKWESVHPAADRYAFELPDRYVKFGEKNGMFVIGHTLVWHNQTPKWVFEDNAGKPVDRETLLKRMHEHIRAVVGRYKGRIKGWDVVNEAVDEDGSLRQSKWLKIIGEDYLVKAYQFAHEADPEAELYYNDFSLENKAKRAGALALVRKLQASGVNISAVGLQGHYKMDWPSAKEIRETISDFAKLGVKVNITELDVDVLPAATRAQGAEVSMNFQLQAQLNPFTNGLPIRAQAALAKRYAEIFAVLEKQHEHIQRVTFWGVTDADSWLNTWPVRGRTNHPLLFDRDGKPKLAFDAVERSVKR
jgi:endo-1,4-beta-xylanase